jgi:alkyl sulfatase BDS1-like metallo-beta-lactamase superfamily hydrolase
LIAVPRPLPRCASQVLDRGAQTDFNGAAQVLDRSAQAVARGAARCASQVLDRGVQADARGAAAHSQQEKNNSADVQQSRVNITGFICTMASQPSR